MDSYIVRLTATERRHLLDCLAYSVQFAESTGRGVTHNEVLEKLEKLLIVGSGQPRQPGTVALHD